jgi:phosphate transport system substrate-binding protein
MLLKKRLPTPRYIAGLWVAGLVIVALLAVACGSTAAQPTDATDQSQTNNIPASLSGNITIDGSSTVFPITEAVAEELGILTEGSVRITVGVSGTGGGFEKFCRGETHITNASRPIRASEIEACNQAGIEFIEIPVAIDGLTVMVNPSNDFVECMTIEELHTIWAPAAEGQITRWSQVRPNWPDEPLHLYGPGVDSGTFDYFTEVVNGEAQASRGDFTASENDNVLVQGIAGDPNSLGYFGYAYYVENQDQLKAVAIDGGNGCVEPTEETINNGTYAPLSRPIFIYVRQDAAEQPHAQEFVRFYLGEEGRELVRLVGYIPFPERVYELALARFEQGQTGTLFGGENPQEGTVADVLASNQQIRNGKGLGQRSKSGCSLPRLHSRFPLLGGINFRSGQVLFKGHDLYAPEVDSTEIRYQIGMVFQRPNPFPKSIYDNVAFGPRINGFKGNVDELVEQSLCRAALWDEVKELLKDSALALSGGQQQRLCIARALAVEPTIILMDEPCSALDPLATLAIEDLMRELSREYSIIIVTHNMQQAGRVSDYTAFLIADERRIGELVEFGETRAVFTNPRDQRTEAYITGRFG